MGCPKLPYHNNLTDHLGSIRITVDDKGNTVGREACPERSRRSYYPFGETMPRRSSHEFSDPHTDVKFTGHELEQQGGLGIYHAQARMYDPRLGRFLSVGPMKQLYPGHTP